MENKPSAVAEYLYSRRTKKGENEKKLKVFNIILYVLTILVFPLPLILLIVYSVTYIIINLSAENSISGEIMLILMGFSWVFFVYGIFKFKFNYYRLSWVTITLLVLSGILLLAY